MRNASAGWRRRRGQSSPPRTKGSPSGRQKGRVPNNSSLYVIRTLNNTRVLLIFSYFIFLHKKPRVNMPRRRRRRHCPILHAVSRNTDILRDAFSRIPRHCPVACRCSVLLEIKFLRDECGYTGCTADILQIYVLYNQRTRPISHKIVYALLPSLI